MSDSPEADRPASRLRDLPWWIYLPIPLLTYPLVVVSAAYSPLHGLYGWLMAKEGAIEWFGVILLVITLITCIPTYIRYRHRLPARWLKVWFPLVFFAMFFLAGEEISWGQHLGLWDEDVLPEWFQEINDQNETNIHNIYGNVFDVNPTNLVVLATLVGCVIIPLVQRWRKKTMPPSDPGYWFWPTRACLPAGIGVLLIRFPHRIHRWIVGTIPEDIEGFWRHSEVHECYIAMLFCVYMLSVVYRLRQMPKVDKAAAAG